MKKINKILSVVLVFFLMLGCSFISGTKNASAYRLVNGEEVYSIIGDRIIYAIEKPLDETIVTFEATIKLPKNLADDIEGGVIMGNYYNLQNWCGDACNFAVGTKGNFRVGWASVASASGTPQTFAYDHTFTEVDLRTGNWEHVAVVYNKASNSMSYYVNGVLKSTHTPSFTIPYEAISTMKFGIGSDWNSWLGKKTPFYGEIKQITAYNTALTQAQIQADVNNPQISTNDRQGLGLIGNWYFGEYWGNEKVIYNSATGGLNCIRHTYDAYVEVEEVGMQGGWDYSFAIIPDIQAMTHNYDKPQGANLTQLHQWLLDNKTSHNIQFVSYVGDLGECQYADTTKRAHVEAEWDFMQSKVHMLDGKIPYSISLGNHDYDDWCRTNRNTTMFDRHFRYDEMKNLPGFGGAYKPGDMDNAYYLIKVSEDVEYLILALEHAPRYMVLNWADRVISEHPNARVILTAHCLVDVDGTFNARGDVTDGTINPRSHFAGSYSGQDVWDRLASKHANMFMTYSGHLSCDQVVTREDIGVHGNKVYSTLVDFQGAMLTSKMNTFLLVKVDEDTKRISFCAYSPEMDACYNEQNQFVFSFADPFNPAVGGV